MVTNRTTHLRAAHRWGSLRNQRGAAFLLAVYFAALTLLLLGGVSLQRTNVESRAAQVTRDQQRAFWLAEAGLDKALQTIRTTPGMIKEAVINPVVIPSGVATYQLMQQGTDLSTWQTGKMQTLYEITASGQVTAASPQTNVSATVGRVGPLRGMVARKSVTIWYSGGDFPKKTTVTGDIAVAGGTPGTVWLDPGVTVKGNVTIGPKDPVNPWLNLYGPPKEQGTAQTDGILLSPEDRSPAEIIDGELWDPARNLSAATITGTTRSWPILSIPSPMAPAQCQLAPFELHDGDDYTLADGKAFDMTPGDGKVDMCVPYVRIKEGSILKVKDPTTIYVTGVYERVLKNPKTGKVMFAWDYAFFNDGKVDTIVGLSKNPNRGLTLIVVAPPGRPRENLVVAGKFEGSIYAPDSAVFLDPTSAETHESADGWWIREHATKRMLGYVVGNRIVATVDIDFTNKKSAANDQELPPSVLRWKN